MDFPKQFAFVPQVQNRIQNADSLLTALPIKKFIVCGMGGSQLAADLLKSRDSGLDIIRHRDYGLPAVSDDELKSRLIIASSYSGNTEETIDGLKLALKKGLHTLIISTGGELVEIAKKHNLPFILIPKTGIQPRCATGYNLMALLRAISHAEGLSEAAELVKKLRAEEFEDFGKNLAEKLKGFVPLIYASAQNFALAYNWKIKLNETGKIPAFCNVFPELNHNEMNSFDAGPNAKHTVQKFSFVFLRDPEKDDLRVKKRMEILKKLYEERGWTVTVVDLEGDAGFHKLFAAVLKADWTAYYMALGYGLDPETVPMVEQFKKFM